MAGEWHAHAAPYAGAAERMGVPWLGGFAASCTEEVHLCLLGPSVVPFLTPFLGGDSVPLLESTTEKSWYPYSHLSNLEDLA